MTVKELGAMQIVNRYTLWSGAAGFVPVPFIDVAAVMGLQVKMLHSLAKHYEQRLSDDWGKVTVTTILGGVLPTSLGYGAVGLLVSKIPLVGGMMGAVTVPALAAAATHALGKVFIVHFESGGTALDFDADKLRAHFQDEFQKAKTAGV